MSISLQVRCVASRLNVGADCACRLGSRGYALSSDFIQLSFPFHCRKSVVLENGSFMHLEVGLAVVAHEEEIVLSTPTATSTDNSPNSASSHLLHEAVMFAYLRSS